MHNPHILSLTTTATHKQRPANNNAWVGGMGRKALISMRAFNFRRLKLGTFDELAFAEPSVPGVRHPFPWLAASEDILASTLFTLSARPLSSMHREGKSSQGVQPYAASAIFSKLLNCCDGTWLPFHAACAGQCCCCRPCQFCCWGCWVGCACHPGFSTPLTCPL